MERKKFVKNAPGQLLQIQVNGAKDWAFQPNPLPPQWNVPEHLWPKLIECHRAIGELEGVGRTLPNPTILLRPLENEEAIRSSRLEGTYVTSKELFLFEMEQREPRSEDDPANSWREVFNYKRALTLGSTSPLPLSLRLIRELHQALLSGVRGRDRAPGEFRRQQVALGESRRFIPPPSLSLPDCLSAFEKYVHSRFSGFDALIDCFLAHYQFEAIHPFLDGNGRIGRVVLAIMLQQRCKLSKPWLYMSTFFEKNRDEYIARLFDVSAKNDWTGWIEFCLNGTINQAWDTIHRCNELLRVKGEYNKRLQEIGGNFRLGKIIDLVFDSPYVRIADLAKILEVSYPTAKADIDRLIQAGILRELEQVSTKTFYAPEVFSVAYSSADSMP